MKFVLSILLATALAVPNTANAGPNGEQLAGAVAFFGGVGLTLGAFNYGEECTISNRSYLGYRCYADQSHPTARLARPNLLYASIGSMVGGIALAIHGKRKRKRAAAQRGFAVSPHGAGVRLSYSWK